MKALKTDKPSLKSLTPVDRSAVRVSEGGLIRPSFLGSEGTPPVVLEATVPGMELAGWAESHSGEIDRLFAEYRAVLFRGFDVRSVEAFQAFVGASSQGPPLEYRDRSTPRHSLGKGIYISTIYPPDQPIHLHNEGTYWRTWALKIYFCCLKTPERGGATPIGDVRGVYRRIDPEVRRRFEEKQVLYVRNYGDGFGLPWQDVFQTESKEEVEEYCAKNAIELEWKEGDRLRTRQRRPAVRIHPETGVPVWFNHAAFFHVTSLDPGVRDMLLSEFGEEGLPYNTYYGDGERIETDVVEAIRQAYRDETIVFTWRDGDVLMMDNMSFAHGREPYEGERKVAVAMTEPWSGEA
jgi:alpha-ketoglutarate-dependent taurine dioxygenase